MERFIRTLKMRYVKILSYSGKGGTGKTLTAVNTALRFAKRGFKVGLLDIDLEMNSVSRSMGYVGKEVERLKNKRKLKPVTHKTHPNLKMFSLSLMPFLSEDTEASIIWGGEYQRQYIFQLLYSVDWGKLDVMVIDCPAGISDSIIALTNIFKKVDYGIITGLNNQTSIDGIVKAIKTLNENNIEIDGVISNQDYYTCPHCNKKSYPLGKGAVKQLCKKMKLNYAGGVPLLETIYKGMETGEPYVDADAYDAIYYKIIGSNKNLHKLARKNLHVWKEE